MSLPWYRKDSTWYEHPKVLELLTMREGFRSLVVWDASIGYATQYGTDGVIRPAVLSRVHGRKADAERLVKVGLWDEHPDGWAVHDFADYQQTTFVTDAIRSAKRVGAAKGNCIRWHGDKCGCWKRQIESGDD
jgi:hypothetical protein